MVLVRARSDQIAMQGLKRGMIRMDSISSAYVSLELGSTNIPLITGPLEEQGALGEAFLPWSSFSQYNNIEKTNLKSGGKPCNHF